MQLVPAAFPASSGQLITASGNATPAASTPVRPGADASTATWQKELSLAVRTVPDLLHALGLSADALCTDSTPHDPARQGSNELHSMPDVSHADSFPILVPRSFVARMRHGDATDPLLRQVLPLAIETRRVPGFVSDAVGDAAARRAPGLLHKYAGRVLLIATGTCAVHCRYCFRRDYPYADEPRRLDDWQPALDVIAHDPSIREVILSGGDPLMLNDERLQILLHRIDAMPHIERIRIHSRLPIVLPSRVTPALVNNLLALRTQPILVVHANHANELTGDCGAGLRRVVRAGVPVLNQAVLLAGVNDSLDALERLCLALVNLGVMPYYLHQLDRVSGTAHFEVARDTGQELIAALRARLPGYAVPRYVEEIPGQSSKMPVGDRIDE